ncbi:hypothetical protein PINS_up001822 [Pythium insidiosum]|nr:hypothetical protein PINS_up001822 [Pythium insidiosum]
MPGQGWVELDVTTAVNDFTAKQILNQQRGQLVREDLTLVVYARATTSFLYNGVCEVTFASKEATVATQRPELRVVASGRVNLAQTAAVSQSHPGSASAAVDGKLTSKLAVSSTFAMSSTAYAYPWWQADLRAVRLIEDVIITVKRRVSSATTTQAQVAVTLWCFLSNTPLGTNNKGLAGFTSAKSNALYQRRFQITTRSFSASETDNVVLRWQVNGERDGRFVVDSFAANFTVPVEAQYLLIQVEGENNVALNEVEIYQQALSTARLSIGGFMPSPSVVRKGKNQISLELNEPDTSSPFCDAATDVCRHELLFTSSNWFNDQFVSVRIVDDAVATGDRDIVLSHSATSMDPDFVGGSDCTSSAVCKVDVFPTSSFKPVRVLDDDEAAVLLSASQVTIEEGSNAFPGAPVPRREKNIIPTMVRCSGSSQVITISKDVRPGDTCGSAFLQSSADWKACIADTTAAPLASGSAWMMAGFEVTKNVTGVKLVVPRMTSTSYVRKFSVWWQSVLRLDLANTTDLLDISKHWIKLESFTVPMKSSDDQTFQLTSVPISPVSSLLVTMDDSYDDSKRCVVAPRVIITANEPVPFPLPTRGDLLSPDAIPPKESRRSRMHQPGKPARVAVRLATEPIVDVMVSVKTDAQNARVSVFDASNSSNVLTSLQDLQGAVYENGETSTFRMPTALLFTAEYVHSHAPCLRYI